MAQFLTSSARIFSKLIQLNSNSIQTQLNSIQVWLKSAQNILNQSLAELKGLNSAREASSLTQLNWEIVSTNQPTSRELF